VKFSLEFSRTLLYNRINQHFIHKRGWEAKKVCKRIRHIEFTSYKEEWYSYPYKVRHRREQHIGLAGV